MRGQVRWQFSQPSRMMSSGTGSSAKPRQPHVTTSSLFLPSRTMPSQEATVKGHKLMLQAGLIRQLASGLYHFLPLGLRALEKLVALIDSEMQTIGGAKMAMPILTPAALWKASGRWKEVGTELFRLKDSSETEFCLGPTHEEPVTELVAQEVTSYRQLPLRLYQVDRKFRDEKRPRLGLLRAREFWMKDMYSFDVDEDKAMETYKEVCLAYERIFKQLDLPAVKVKADPGNIGGSLSHEYHFLSEVGEDTIVTCERCRQEQGLNKELLLASEEQQCTTLPECPFHGKGCLVTERKGVEVAHTFLLGTKYSSVFKASFKDNNNQKQLCQMGCYGIGVSRLLAAIIEHGCTFKEEQLLWPSVIAPYFACIAPLTTSKDPTDPHYCSAQELYHILQETVCPGDVVMEDRTQLTLGFRIRSLQATGYPVTIITGEKAPPGKYELHIQTKTSRETQFLSKSELVEQVAELYSRTKLSHLLSL